MPGMGHGVDIHNPVVTNLFRLGLHVSFVWVLAFAVLFALGLAFVALRSPDGVPPLSEARPRTTLRVGFGSSERPYRFGINTPSLWHRQQSGFRLHWPSAS